MKSFPILTAAFLLSGCVVGTIAEVHVENAEAVEFGQPLFRVMPA